MRDQKLIAELESLLERAKAGEKVRTPVQNRSLHAYFTLVAESLNNSNLSVRDVLKPGVDVPWTPLTVKELLWRSVQRIFLGKESTSLLSTKEVNQVYEIVDRHLSQIGLDSIPFPSNAPPLPE